MIWLILGIGLLLLLLVGLKLRSISKQAPPAQKTTSNTKRSQAFVKSYADLLTLEGEFANIFEKDPVERMKTYTKISDELEENFNQLKTALEPEPIPTENEEQLKEAKSAIRSAETALQDAMRQGVEISQSAQQLLQDAQKALATEDFEDAKEFSHKCTENVNAAMNEFERQKAEQARKARPL